MNKSIQRDYLDNLNKGNIKGCLHYLKIKEGTIFQYTDNLGFTILNKASNLNLYEECREILEIIIKYLTKFEFISFINQKNQSGFTPLHYACYNGYMKLIKLLVNNGADINTTNNNGLNILHMASRGNKSTPLYYFIHKYRMNVNSTYRL